MGLQINELRLAESLQSIASFHEDNTLYTRRAFTPAYHQARKWLQSQMEYSGLSVRIDAAGNLIGRREGVLSIHPVIATGSHNDTVADGGRFDGIVGVMAGLEIMRSLNDLGVVLNHTLELIDFLAEEPSPFGISTIGSRAMSGHLTQEMLSRVDQEGRTLADCIDKVGGNSAQLGHALRSPNDMKAFLELHIEQGPVLEANEADIGLVTGIVGIHRFQVTVIGAPGHAGTVPLEVRQDALVTASRMVVAVRELAQRYRIEHPALVATVGTLQVFPNHANVIPGRVTFSLEIRSTREEWMSELGISICDAFENIAVREHCGVSIEVSGTSSPTAVNRSLLEATAKSAETLRLRTIELPSGAGHDSSHMANITPVGMIFIPCAKGISHSPEEFSTLIQIANGVRTLAETILLLDVTI